MPPVRGSAAGQKFLASPYYSRRAAFASPLSAFFIMLVVVQDVIVFRYVYILLTSC